MNSMNDLLVTLFLVFCAVAGIAYLGFLLALGALDRIAEWWDRRRLKKWRKKQSGL